MVAEKRSMTDYMISYYSKLRPHTYNDGMPPNVAEAMYWNTQKALAKNT